jgi:hypothetical protein
MTYWLTFLTVVHKIEIPQTYDMNDLLKKRK